MLTQGLAARVLPIASFQLYLAKTERCSLVLLFRKEKLDSECTPDLLFERLVLALYGLYLLISQEIQLWRSGLSGLGVNGSTGWAAGGFPAGGSLRSRGSAGLAPQGTAPASSQHHLCSLWDLILHFTLATFNLSPSKIKTSSYQRGRLISDTKYLINTVKLHFTGTCTCATISVSCRPVSHQTPPKTKEPRGAVAVRRDK